VRCPADAALAEMTPMCRDYQQHARSGECCSGHNDPSGMKSQLGNLRRNEPDTGDHDEKEPNLRKLEAGGVSERKHQW
jgi:hypothetical protein